MSYCIRCGQAAQAEQAFCRNCGAALRQQAETPAPDPHPSPEPAAAAWPNTDADSTQAQPPASHGQAENPLPASAAAGRSPEHDSPTATWVPQSPATSEPAPPGAWPTAAGTQPPLAGTDVPPAAPPADTAGWPPPPARPPYRANRHRAGTVIAVVALLLLLGGAAAAWKLLGHRTGQSAQRDTAGRRPAAETTGPRSGSTSAAGGAGTPAPTAPSSGTQVSGPDAVAIAPTASQQASAPQVAEFLRDYFRAINNRNYGLYSSLYELSVQPTPGQFYQGYRSTHDSGAVLTGLSGIPNGLAASVSFTSHQNPADSKIGTSCTAWHVTLYLQPSGSSYLIGSPPSDYHAQYQACP